MPNENQQVVKTEEEDSPQQKTVVEKVSRGKKAATSPVLKKRKAQHSVQSLEATCSSGIVTRSKMQKDYNKKSK